MASSAKPYSNNLWAAKHWRKLRLVGETLGRYGVQVILDYGVEGKQGEESFDHATEEFIRVINYAATQTNIPFISIKVTGLARFGLLQTLTRPPPAQRYS
jgi:proline dehydrogenase